MPHSDVRWIVRPRALLTTPKILRETLGARRTVAYPDSAGRKYSFKKDFFLVYPPIELIEDLKTDADHQTYQSLRSFAGSSKPSQRNRIAAGGIECPASPVGSNANSTPPDTRGTGAGGASNLQAAAAPAPTAPGTRYVVRPVRHSKGDHYRITSDPEDYVKGKEYISVLFPKAFEYRVIFVKGKEVCTLLKKVPEGIDPDGPWNHANGASFITVRNPELNRLRNYDVVEKLLAHDIIKSAHLVGVDILLGKKKKDGYVVTEFNFCPALTIETNLELVKQHAHPAPD